MSDATRRDPKFFNTIADDARAARFEAKEHIELAIAMLLSELVGDDWPEDENLVDTPARVARMYVDELCAGLYTESPRAVAFSSEGVDELCIIGPVTIRSLCAHHLLPVTGRAWVGIIPDEKVLGLSKYARLLAWSFARPTLQEVATVEAAKRIVDLLKPKGLGLVVQASHGCMTCRGVKEDEAMCTTSYLDGVLRDAAPRAEFLSLVRPGLC